MFKDTKFPFIFSLLAWLASCLFYFLPCSLSLSLSLTYTHTNTQYLLLHPLVCSITNPNLHPAQCVHFTQCWFSFLSVISFKFSLYNCYFVSALCSLSPFFSFLLAGHGQCNCGRCDCKEGWAGKKCEHPLSCSLSLESSVKKCRGTSNLPCFGRGTSSHLFLLPWLLQQACTLPSPLGVK